MSLTRTFSASSLAFLAAHGENAILNGGYRSVSNTSYMAADSLDSQATVLIPETIESVETLQFLELRPVAAQKVYNDFLLAIATYPERADIFYIARDHVMSIQGDAFIENDDWIGVMERVGMNSNFQTRIMDAEYKRIRLSANVKYWIIEMMTMRMALLRNLDSVIKGPNNSGTKHKASHLDLAGKIQPGPKNIKIPERTSSKGKDSEPPQIGNFKTSSSSTVTLAGPSNFKTDSPSAPKAAEGRSTNLAKAADIPQAIDGCTMFYKGGDISRLNGIFGSGPRLNVRAILRNPPGDFTGYTAAIYLSKQPALAWEYAQWAKKLVDGNVVPVGVLAIAIPQSLLSNIYSVVGGEWRKLVWVSRRRASGDDTNSLAHLFDYKWITGPLCQQNNDTVARYKEVSQIVPWKLNSGESASQHFTASQGMWSQLDVQCVGKVWLTEIACDSQ